MFGILNCHKPVGMSSRDLVNIVQRRVRPLKAGHAGTLDPLASGVLLVAVGPAVRLVPYLQQQTKQYVARFRLGQWSPTGDLEGPLSDEPDPPQPTADQLRAAIATQVGNVRQVPPRYSAIKVGGRRACDLVRGGQTVELAARTVQIHSIECQHYAYPDLGLRITCGAGTYIRSLGVDIAAACGTTAVMTALVRTAIGSFGCDQALTLDQLRDGPLETQLIDPAAAVAQMAQVRLEDEQVRAVECGQTIPLTIPAAGAYPTADAELSADAYPAVGVELAAGAELSADAELAALDRHGRLRAILVRRGGDWRPRRVFPAVQR